MVLLFRSQHPTARSISESWPVSHIGQRVLQAGAAKLRPDGVEPDLDRVGVAGQPSAAVLAEDHDAGWRRLCS